MKRLIVLLLLMSVVVADPISEKRASLVRQASSQESAGFALNHELEEIKRQLGAVYLRAQKLAAEDAAGFRALLGEVHELKRRKEQIEEAWKEKVAKEEEGEPYALWDQDETTVAQLVMEYGASDYLYIVPAELSQVKLQLHSNIPIPRESWGELLEILLHHQGIGLKRVNPFAKQLYMLKQDLSAIQFVSCRKQELPLLPAGSRICFLLQPPVEQTRSVFQFLEKFSDSKQTFVHLVGGKVVLVAMKEEVSRLLDFYDKVWGEAPGKVARVISVSKMPAHEMETILHHFFSGAVEQAKLPFGKQEQDSLVVLPMGSSLALIGSKESVDRAEKVVRETEDQLEDPAEMTIYLYTCRHSDPTDLAHVLEKVYLSLIYTNQEAPRELDANFSSQVQAARPPADGYPPMAPLVVTPPPLKPGLTAKLDVEEGPTTHFIPDPKTGTILMTVRRDALQKIKDLVKKLDVPKKMVQIEVLLFERRLHSQNNYGLNLLKLGKSRNGVTYMPTVGPHPRKEHLHGVLQFFFHGPAHKYTPHFDVAYNFLLTQNDIQLNAAPSVTTINQTPATISLVEEISINNGAAPIDTNKGISFEKSFARANYGIIIVLTPTIHIAEKPGESSSVTLQTNITFDTTKPHPDDRPMVDRRHIENEVRVIDGDTVILGGLRRKSRNDHEEKVALFGDLPGIGKLFGTTQLTDNDTEMIFFITPKIILDPQEEVEKIRTEELKKRPGDIPEFLQRVEEAHEKQKAKFFHDSFKSLFTNDR